MKIPSNETTQYRTRAHLVCDGHLSVAERQEERRQRARRLELDLHAHLDGGDHVAPEAVAAPLEGEVDLQQQKERFQSSRMQ